MGSVLRVQEDLIGAHERLMSTSIADLLARSPGGVDLRDACSHLQERLRAARPLDVRVTLTGLAGDSGTQCPGRLLFSSGPRRDLLWSNEAIFRTAMTYREVVRIARTSIITHRSHVMGFCMGLSNRKVMCPFPSVGRNEDGVFAVLLSASDPSALFGHVPLGVVHDSHRPSEYDVTSGTRRHAGRLEGESRFRSLRSATESSISELVIAFLLTLVTGIRGTTPATRLREVGNELARLARLSPRAFVGLVRDSIDGLRTRQLEYGERATELPGCPPYWRRALIEYRAGFLDARARPEFFLPREFHGLGSLEAGFESLRRVIGEFGALVAEWPSLWKAARSLNASGSAN